MADKIPIRGGFSGASLTGLAQFASGDTLGVAHGGTGVVTIGSNALVTGNGTSAMTSESNLTFDGTILKSTGDLCATVKVVAPALCIGSQYVLPTADGSAGQLMCTDGSGALAFATAASSGADPTSTNTWTADQTFNDNVKVTLGTGGDADIYFDGTDTIINSQVVGTGNLVVRAGATSSATPNVKGMLLEDSAGVAFTIGTGNTSEGMIHFADNGAGNSGRIIYAHNEDDMYFSTAATERMRITSAGNVGIGTATLAGKLHVSQTTAGTYTGRFDNNQEDGPTLYVNHTGASSATNPVLRVIAASVNALEVKSDGKVGIGTTTPQGTLNVQTASSGGTAVVNGDDLIVENSQNVGLSLLTAAGNVSGVYFGDADDADIGFIRYVHSSDYMQFDVNAAERMRIDSAGVILATNSDSNEISLGGGISLGAKGISITYNDASDWGEISALHRGTAHKPLYMQGGGAITCIGGALCSAGNMCVGGTLGKSAGSFVINHPCCGEEDTPNNYNAMNLVHGFSEGPKYGIQYDGTSQLNDRVTTVKMPEYFNKLQNKNGTIHIQLTNVAGWSPLVVMEYSNGCKICGNCFKVCTTAEGDPIAKFDWFLTAERGDDFVLNDNEQTDDDGHLIVEQWRDWDKIAKPKETLDALSEEEYAEWINYRERKAKNKFDRTADKFISPNNIDRTKTKEDQINDLYVERKFRKMEHFSLEEISNHGLFKKHQIIKDANIDKTGTNVVSSAELDEIVNTASQHSEKGQVQLRIMRDSEMSPISAVELAWDQDVPREQTEEERQAEADES